MHQIEYLLKMVSYPSRITGWLQTNFQDEEKVGGGSE